MGGENSIASTGDPGDSNIIEGTDEDNSSTQLNSYINYDGGDLDQTHSNEDGIMYSLTASYLWEEVNKFSDESLHTGLWLQELRSRTTVPWVETLMYNDVVDEDTEKGESENSTEEAEDEEKE